MFEDFDEYMRQFAAYYIEVYVPRFDGAIAFDDESLKSILYHQSRVRVPRVREEPKTDRDRFVSRACGIAQDRKIQGNSIMILGRAFLENGLTFKTTQEAMLGWPRSGAITPKKKNTKKAAR
jgi:hypothetical protein